MFCSQRRYQIEGLEDETDVVESKTGKYFIRRAFFNFLIVKLKVTFGEFINGAHDVKQASFSSTRVSENNYKLSLSDIYSDSSKGSHSF